MPLSIGHCLMDALNVLNSMINHCVRTIILSEDDLFLRIFYNLFILLFVVGMLNIIFAKNIKYNIILISYNTLLFI